MYYSIFLQQALSDRSTTKNKDPAMSLNRYIITLLCFIAFSRACDNPLELLRIAIYGNNMSLTRKILLQNPNLDLNQQVCDTTILSTAVIKGTPAMVRQLIQHGACIHTKEHNGNTPLHIACLMGKLEVTKVLLAQNADPLALNNDAITPLHYAASTPNPQLCAELLRHTQYIDPQDNKGQTPFMYAIAHKLTRQIQILLDKGASLSIQDDSGATPLHLATRSLNSVQPLLNKHANPNARDNRNAIPLHYAVYTGEKTCVKELLKISDINAQDKKGATPLLVSILFGHEDIAQLLLHKRANPNIIAHGGFPPLHVAVKLMPSLVPELFKYGADPFAHNLGRELIKQAKNRPTRRYLINIMQKKQLESCSH